MNSWCHAPAVPLRTVFSLAWVAGPPLAALLLAAGGFRLVYGAAAIPYAIAGLVAIVWLGEVGTPEPVTAATGDAPTVDAAVAGAVDAAVAGAVDAGARLACQEQAAPIGRGTLVLTVIAFRGDAGRAAVRAGSALRLPAGVRPRGRALPGRAAPAHAGRAASIRSARSAREFPVHANGEKAQVDDARRPTGRCGELTFGIQAAQSY